MVDRIRGLAERQHGVVSRDQLRAMGLTRKAIDHRVAKGLLLPVHRGVYAVGHSVLARNGRFMAAVLACGPGAVLSHRDAAALWGIRKDHRATIDVTVPARRRGSGTVTVHESPLADDERTTRSGIPVTTLFRTVIDLATVVTDVQLRRAINEAERQGPQPPPSLASLCERHAGRAGIPRVREQGGLTTRLTRSRLEDAFLAYCEHHALPLPQTNATVLGYEVDCLWRDHRLVAELDGYEFHRTRIDLVDDRTKDQDLQASGLRVTRINQEHLRTPRLADRLHAMMRR